MLFANVNGEKFEAKPQTTGLCPLCEHPVFSKCGEVNVWHWAHYKDESCDNWYEPETEWHKNWKLIFGKENSEIIISKYGVRPIADVQATSTNNNKVIIELQNSPIQREIIRKRELFYGEHMLWVINGKHFESNFSVHPFQHSIRKYIGYDEADYASSKNKTFQNLLDFIWSYPRKSWNDVHRPVFIDFGDDQLLF